MQKNNRLFAESKSTDHIYGKMANQTQDHDTQFDESSSTWKGKITIKVLPVNC